MLNTVPIIGQIYNVLCTNGNGTYNKDIPVIGIVHNDKDIDLPPFDHLHIDYRFISDEDLMRLFGAGASTIDMLNKKYEVRVIPGSKFNIYKKDLQCIRLFDTETEHDGNNISFKSGNVSEVARKNKWKLNLNCKVCPHHKTDLSSCKSIHGTISCPAHGLRFDDITGELL